jgi:hypothetical protein
MKPTYSQKLFEANNIADTCKHAEKFILFRVSKVITDLESSFVPFQIELGNVISDFKVEIFIKLRLWHQISEGLFRTSYQTSFL